MARYAYIVDDRVQEIFGPARPSLHPDVLAQLVEVPAACEAGWLRLAETGAFVPPPGDLRCPTWDGTQWVEDGDKVAAEMDDQAARGLGTPTNRALAALLWDLETRLRAAGQASTLAAVAAVADDDRAGYKKVLHKMVRDLT